MKNINYVKNTKTTTIFLMASILSFSNIGISCAEEGPLKIIEGGLFQKPKYQINSEIPVELTGDDGFNDQFTKVLSLHPAALSQAELAKSAAPISVAGSIIMLAGTVIMLQDTMKQADDPLAEDPDYSKSLGLVIVGAVISVVGSTQYKSHLNKAVKLFNEGEKTDPKLGNSSTNEYINPSYKQTRMNMGFNLDIPKYHLNETQTQVDNIALMGNVQYRF